MVGPGPLVLVGEDGQKLYGQGEQLYIISIVTVVLAGFVVAARIATRLTKLAAELGPDDYCVVLALLMSAVLSTTECMAVVHGYGHHSKDLTEAQKVEALKWFYLAQIFYKVVITLDKVAILLFYLRLFPNHKFRRFTFAGLAFVGASGAAYILGTVWQCTPISLFWDRAQPGHCFQNAPWWISYSSLNIATDFYLLVLPVPLIWSLSLTIRNKLAVIGIFAVGCFVCFATIIRMTTLASSAGKDFTYDPIPATNWSVIEANVGLICACLPMFKRYLDMFARLFGRQRSSAVYSSNASKPYNRGIYRLSSRSQPYQDTKIFGTGGEWGTVDNRVIGNSSVGNTMSESQENIIEARGGGIYKNVELKVERDLTTEPDGYTAPV